MSRAKTSWTILLACVALLVVDIGVRAQRGARMSARTSVNRSGNFNRNINRNVDVNRNFNRNVDVNRNINRNIDIDRDIDIDRNYGGWGGCCYHPVARATAAAVTTAAVVGSMAYSLPSSCESVNVNGYTYQQCGSTWYMPQFSGSSVTYVVVNPPR